MLIRHLAETHRQDLLVSVTDPDATVADLAAVLEPDRPAGPLLVDGRAVPASTPLDRAAIAHGATVRRPPPPGLPPPPAPAGPGVVLTVTAGPDAGRSVRLAPGTHRIGRAPGPGPAIGEPPPVPATGLWLHDPTVSAHHATLHVAATGAASVSDDGSTNGTWLGDVAVRSATSVGPGAEVRCGASRFVVEPTPPPASPERPPLVGAARTRPLHRRPRPALPGPAPTVAAPQDPDPPPPVTPVGLVAVLASVATGAAMVVLLHSWSYAAFALLGPVLVLANAVDSRRRRRRHGRRAGRRRARELRAFAAALASAQQAALAAARAAAPGPASSVRTAHHDPGACWERRPDHDDARTVRIGIGRVAWDPPTATTDAVPPATAPDVTAVVDAHRWLDDAPLALRLAPGRAVAVVGPLVAAHRLVRSIVVQAVVAHGPADVRVGVLAAPDRARSWDWCAWLPHAADPVDGWLLAGSEGQARSVVDVLAPAADAVTGAPRRWCGVVVLDDPRALAARRSAARTLLRLASDPDVGLVPIVLVERPEDVPASCQVVLTVTAEGTLHAPGLAHGEAALVGVAEDVAREVARALAGLDDPEVDDPGRDLPGAVSLADLVGAERLTPAGTTAAWRAGGDDPPPRAVVGASAEGPFVVDLAADGPHALVAGTTGAGKSELLRTLVASLAASSSPRHLTFVLIDFKGGSAFDVCARLPHVTGVVTDLDDHLAARALACLDAELRHREQRLRAAGAEDLADLRRREPGGEPLPCLVVVVDEFATLAAELPDFVDSLVGVAQRGRSLGVHLVLATQRPSGAVSERIRANTALRVALRVQSPADSTDVIDAPGAADLPRRCPGRALVRLGPGELVAVQVARSSSPAPGGGADGEDQGLGRSPLEVRRLGVPDAAGGTGPEAASAPGPGAVTRTDLDLLVDAAAAAWAGAGEPAPRRPWPDPLPLQLDWPLPPGPGPSGPALVLGMADRPDRQRHEPWAWHLDDGPLLAVGLPGSGTTTLAATAVLAAGQAWGPSRCHVHVIDLGAGDLDVLAGLPHVGAVIGADDLERQRRLLADLTDDLAGRRAGRGRHRDVTGVARRLVVVDGLGAFRSRWPDLDHTGTWERLLSLATDGSALGIHLLLTAEGVASAPHRLVSACRQRLVFRLGERADHSSLGIPASAVPPLPPGRAVASDGPHVVQVARPPEGLGAATARLAGHHEPASDPHGVPAVGRLPRALGRDGLGPSTADPDGSLALALGVADDGLVPMHLRLGPGGHAVVAGPPRSGRTSALLTLGRAAVEAGGTVVAVAPAAEPWRSAGIAHRLPGADLADLLAWPGLVVVLVDDADRTDDDHPVLSVLASGRRSDRHVVAAARSDRLRSLYGHWTRELRADRTGVLLQPDPDLDGDLLGTRIPRHLAGAAEPGRGWGCGTAPEGLVQVADPAR